MNSENFEILVNLIINASLILSIYFIFIFLQDRQSFSMIFANAGLFSFIIVVIGLYSKDHFSHKISNLIMIPLVLIELFLALYIFIVIPGSRTFIVGLGLIILLLIVLVVISAVIKFFKSRT